MKRGGVSTVYKCVCCKSEYDTKEEAAVCSIYEPVIKVGDVITFNNHPWLITGGVDDTGYLTIQQMPEYFEGSGCHKRRGLDRRLALPLAYFCNKKQLKHFSLKEAKKYVKTRTKQLKAANLFLQKVASGSSSGENNVNPRINVRAPRLARKNDRAVKHLPKKSVL